MDKSAALFSIALCELPDGLNGVSMKESSSSSNRQTHV